ncbi:hypothetical protein ACMXYX_06005 [Neptuniibacter sp. QD72_48]|uniref:hypothetical protein n=1 Tax=unclassified Neptuniibacter TaxID=2630693 RepID=UPI0039F5D235
MLGTRIILLSMSGIPGEEGNTPEAEVICAANHDIPLFWLLSFTCEDLQYFEVAAENDDILSHSVKTKYPVLVADRAKLLDRLEQRYTLIKPFISDGDGELLHRWVQFISKLSAPVIAMDTYELWCNSGEQEQLSDDILAKLSLFDGLSSKNASNAFEELKRQGVWQEGNQIALAGFGW